MPANNFQLTYQGFVRLGKLATLSSEVSARRYTGVRTPGTRPPLVVANKARTGHRSKSAID
jgi:hypothetical protein